jgi:hypothetical protein
MTTFVLVSLVSIIQKLNKEAELHFG